MSRPKWTQLMLERSKMASLTVDADLEGCESGDPTLQTMKETLRHIHRTKALRVCGLTSAMTEAFIGATISTPILQSLILACPTRYFSDTDRLPEAMVTGDTPSLRRLELVGWIASWSSPLLLSGLTHLKIHQNDPSIQSTMAEIIAALETMPALETLELENALPAVPDSVVAVPVPERTIGLTCLSRIAITAKVLECAQLLRHLSFPSTVSIKLVCKATPAIGHDFSSILGVFSRNNSTNTRACEEPQIRTLHVFGWRNTLTVAAWTRVFSTDLNDPLHDIKTPKHIELNLQWSGPARQDIEAVAIAVCKALTLDWLRSLSLGFTLSDQHEWLAIFGDLSELKTLELRSLTAAGIDSVSSILQRHNQAAESHGISFPMLRNLIFTLVVFMEDGEPPTSHNLLDCLIARYEQHAEIQTVVLLGCRGLFKNDVGLLREVVVDVRWDGLELKSYSRYDSY